MRLSQHCFKFRFLRWIMAIIAAIENSLHVITFNYTIGRINWEMRFFCWLTLKQIKHDAKVRKEQNEKR
jgi:hypothetical protein